MRQFWLAVPAVALATGLDLAGIDRSVAPGDDFFAHANGTWLEDDRDPGRPRELRRRAPIVAELTTQRTAELIQQAAEAGAAGGLDGAARSATSTRASWTRPRSRPRASRRSSRRSTASRRSPIAGSRSRARRDAARRRRRRSTPRTSTPTTSSASGSRRTSTIRRATLPFLLQGGLDMPDREYYLDRLAAHGGDPHAVPGARRRASSSWRGVADAAAKAARIVDLEAPDRRRCTPSREDSHDVHEGATTTGRAHDFDSARARPRLARRSSRPPASGEQPRVRGLAAGRGDRPLGPGRQRAARRRGRTT